MKQPNIWRTPIALEMKIANIICNQAKHGVNFNRAKAAFGIHILAEKIINIDKELVPLLPEMQNIGTSYKKPFKKNGDLAHFVQNYADSVGLTREEIGGPFTALYYTPFDTSKTDKLKVIMAESGWIPANWNIKRDPLAPSKAFTGQTRIDMEEEILNKYIEKTILGNNKVYTTLILNQMGFKGKRTLGRLKEALRKTRYWITSPKITPDEDIFVGDAKIGSLTQARMVWSHRKSLLEGLIKVIRPDGKISGEANSCATPTARMKHRKVVNIPASRAPFGHWCRSLFMGDFDDTVTKASLFYPFGKKEGFNPEELRLKEGTNIVQEFDSKKKKWKDVGKYCKYVPKGRQIFVGYDGAGLELRMLAHYVGDDNFSHQILEGDIHSYNQTLAGLPTRDNAKTFIYAFLYGAGDAKIGSIINGTSADGKEIKARFMKSLPLLAALIEKVQDTAGKFGYVEAIDGRRLYLRRGEDGKYQTHKALNVLLQGAGAIVMKWAMARLHEQVKKAGLRAIKVLDIHDEGQWTCHPDDVTKLREFMESCVKWAGEKLQMKIPLASDSIVGSSWVETH